LYGEHVDVDVDVDVDADVDAEAEASPAKKRKRRRKRKGNEKSPSFPSGTAIDSSTSEEKKDLTHSLIPNYSRT
jgi:hypothetical protein